MVPSPSARKNAAEPPADRAVLRRQAIAARQALSEEVHRQHSVAIESHLESLLLSRAPATLGFCWPVRAEFDCRTLATRLLERGWRFSLPAVVQEGQPLAFYRWQPGDAMAQDLFGIPVPAEPQALAPDIVLIPLVAFDGRGYRLGYGGGYFDRTLAAQVPRPLAIGVGFEIARVATVFPEAHDIPMDAIVTEAGVMLRPEA